MRKQSPQLYYDLLHHKCKIERRVLDNASAIATWLPHEFAYHLITEPGYMVILSAKVVHSMKFIQVGIEWRPSIRCYDQSPVSWNKTNHFFLLELKCWLEKEMKLDVNN